MLMLRSLQPPTAAAALAASSLDVQIGDAPNEKGFAATVNGEIYVRRSDAENLHHIRRNTLE